jgi:hypothetical protein
MIVRDHDNLEDIGTDLKLMLYIVAGFCSALLFAVIFGITKTYFDIVVLCRKNLVFIYG